MSPLDFVVWYLRTVLRKVMNFDLSLFQSRGCIGPIRTQIKFVLQLVVRLPVRNFAEILQYFRG